KEVAKGGSVVSKDLAKPRQSGEAPKIITPYALICGPAFSGQLVQVPLIQQTVNQAQRPFVYTILRNYTYYAPTYFPTQVNMLPQAFHTMTQDPFWNMDTRASSHLEKNTCILTSFGNSSIYPSVFVGNGHSIPVTHTGHRFSHISHKPLHLNHILVTPHIIKNLIFVRKFTRDNDVFVEVDAYGFSVKDYQTQKLLFCCDSTGDLYPVTQQLPLQTPVVLLSLSSTTWHRRLGHPREDVLRRLESANVNVVRSMWLFKHKFNADGSLNMYKARLVANGRSQKQDIDCDETFSLVVKPATIRTVLSLAFSHDWPIHQLDIPAVVDLIDLVDVFRHAVRLEDFVGAEWVEDQVYVGFKFPTSMRCMGIYNLTESSFPFVLPFRHQLRELHLIVVYLRAYSQCLLIQRCSNLEVVYITTDLGNMGLQVIGQFCKKLRKFKTDKWVTPKGLITMAQGCLELESLQIKLSDISNETMECIGTI
nr:ribonuclease H-like domain-containing protein [Tanacetum cinerariifolium]